MAPCCSLSGRDRSTDTFEGAEFSPPLPSANRICGVSLTLGKQVYDPKDPMSRMFFNILATCAEFESDLIRLRTREDMKIARDKGKLRGKPPKLSDLQQRELLKMRATGEYSISDLGKLFKVSRPTVYQTIRRGEAAS